MRKFWPKFIFFVTKRPVDNDTLEAHSALSEAEQEYDRQQESNEKLNVKEHNTFLEVRQKSFILKKCIKNNHNYSIINHSKPFKFRFSTHPKITLNWNFVSVTGWPGRFQDFVYFPLLHVSRVPPFVFFGHIQRPRRGWVHRGPWRTRGELSEQQVVPHAWLWHVNSFVERA